MEGWEQPVVTEAGGRLNVSDKKNLKKSSAILS